MTEARRVSIFQNLLVAVALIAVSPLILMAVGFYLLAGILLHIAVWCIWCTRSQDVLLVYSNSPIWQDYIEQHLLPQLGRRAVLLNWSERREWKQSLAVIVFRFFGGSREYNPIAVVFRPFRLARVFRFYKPFREFKHGKPEAVAALREELVALLGGNELHSV